MSDSVEKGDVIPNMQAVISCGGSGLSWNTFRVYGTQESIAEVERLISLDATVAYLRDRLKQENDE